MLHACRLGILACLLFLSLATQAEALKVKPALNSNPERILFVGNSYYYYNNSLHNHVSNLVKASDPALGARLLFKSSTIGGAALNHHNMAHLTEPGRIGVTQAFQWVVMQGGSGEPLSQRRREIFRQTAIANAEMIKALQSKEMKEKLAAEGAEPVGSSPLEFANLIKSDYQKWAGVAKRAGIEPQ